MAGESIGIIVKSVSDFFNPISLFFAPIILYHFEILLSSGSTLKRQQGVILEVGGKPSTMLPPECVVKLSLS